MTLTEQLAEFAVAQTMRGPGPLCVALVITQTARQGLPLDPDSLVTARGGQVMGLGKGAVQAVLLRHGIVRTLAEEGGRTSRGSMSNMKKYVEFLNSLPAPVDLDAVEAFWIDRVKEHFAGKPFKFRADPSLSIRASVRELLGQASARQKDIPGSRFEGTMLQHLVGAKLDIILGDGAVSHHGAAEADRAEGRQGDFVVGDVAIHVTTHPGEALMRKCRDNLSSGLRSMIVTNSRGCLVAEGLAEQIGIGSRVDILDAEQFLAANLHEWGRFAAATRGVATSDLISRYNRLIETHETDPSLKVELL